MEIVAAFLLLEETESSLSKVIDIFKSYNPSWEYVRVIMTDKDITERDVLKTSLPKAELLICLFHNEDTQARNSSRKNGDNYWSEKYVSRNVATNGVLYK